ncbi:hypothetical protein AXX12_08220 [Anaerosporomusa subterranea]|uniref:Organic solvent tolerance protein OstA n=1 Tax=Anaerosporomusa subterranea TaxID=1794912 RepID=A0A154BR89_ANASB|nr:LPS export ABC transporter periplasmic protein LptC [Anaerosporomusa subterranea]KYZ76409.1 hypothetical protein AXX12_08220 [Anaerosporomusa subterranea]
MRKNNKRVLGVLALLLAFGQLPSVQPITALAATAPSVQNGKSAAPEPSAPTVIEADQVYFSDMSGDMSARGNVKITQNQDTILTEYMRGNQKQTTIWVDGSATLIQPDTKITGNGLTYNYNAKTGVINQAKGVVTEFDIPPVGTRPGSGNVKRKFLTGKNVELAPGYLVASEATYTGCELETPDYHMSADKVEIWPGDKMVAHNAKFWIGNTVVYATSRYESKLGEKNGSPFPHIGYDGDDGVYIRQSLQYPIANNLKAYANLTYYSEAGFKPNYGVKWDKSDYYFEITAGDFNDDDVWIEKKPEFRFGLPTRRIGTTPFSYYFTAVYGKWTENNRTSWHQEYDLYFSHDPIPLDKAKSLNLYLGTGIEHIRESYDDSSFTSLKFNSSLGKAWNPKLYTYIGYNYTQNQSAVFTYDQADVATELVAGVSYTLDKNHTVYYSHSYDLDAQKTYSQTYGWNQNFHCWGLNAYHTTYTDGQDSKTSVRLVTNF